MRRTQNILNSSKSKESVNSDSFIDINLQQNHKILNDFNINEIVDVNERFNQERNSATKYRFIFTLNQISSNVLTNLTDSTNDNIDTLSYFNDYEFLDNSYPQDDDINDDGDLNYIQSLKNYLIEKNGWFGYYKKQNDIATSCDFVDLEPKKQRFSFLPDVSPYHNMNGTESIKNWDFLITYPSHKDDTHQIINGGVLIIDINEEVINEKTYQVLTSPIKHNLKIGDRIKITGSSGIDGFYDVMSLGYNNEQHEYHFGINAPSFVITSSTRFVKIDNGLECSYYFRIFSKIKTIETNPMELDDNDIYKLGFSKNYFTEDLTQLIFNEDIDVSDLKDNLGRPLSELYLTLLKRSSNDLFGVVTSGLDIPYLDRLKTSSYNSWLLSVPTINRIHDGGYNPFISHIPLEGNIRGEYGTTYYGDVVEYNPNTLNETVLNDVNHRFNTQNRIALSGNTLEYVYKNEPIELKSVNLGPRQEGYKYKPHYKIQIREFSDYIEEGDENTYGVPDYAVERPDGVIIWRDLMDIGDGVDYPFLNGSHYIHKFISVFIKRQDPFGKEGLFWNTFPADKFGLMVDDKYDVKDDNLNEIC